MSALPSSVRQGVRDALAEIGSSADITTITPVGGGCINHGVRLDMHGGESLFLKWNASAPDGMFHAEADGLRALRGPGALRVPEPLAHGGGKGSPAWLLLEYVPPGSPAPDTAVRLARGLARIHTSAPKGSDYGWSRDNWIGSLPQGNAPRWSWGAFWTDARLRPQLHQARRHGRLGAHHALLDRVVELVPTALADVEGVGPHLVHGDLWGGNAYPGPGGEPVLIDPAVYRGHGEVDLAMTELFGGFASGFYEAYDEVVGITDGYAAFRRDLYQLYYLLVHVNLFGASYEGGTAAAARRVVHALG